MTLKEVSSAYSLGQGAGAQVNRSKVEELDSNYGELLVLWTITDDCARVSMSYFSIVTFP